MNPTVILLPILAALSEGREPFKAPITRDKAYILEYFGLNDQTTRKAKAKALLPSVQKSLQRQVQIRDAVASTREADGMLEEGTTFDVLDNYFDYQRYKKLVVRSALHDAHKRKSNTTTIVPDYDTTKYQQPFATKPYESPSGSNRTPLDMYRSSLRDITQDFYYLVLQQAPAECLQTTQEGKKFCRLPLRAGAGTIHFAQYDSSIATVQDLLEIIGNYKNSRPATDREKVHIALPRIDIQQRLDDGLLHFELTYNAQQDLSSDGNNFVSDTARAISQKMDFIIPCTQKTLCWIEDSNGLMTFATVCDPSTYSKFESNTEHFNGSLADFPE